MGATASMLGWPDALYAVEDMADDVLAILDSYGIEQATLMGMSLGGYIAQMLALEHPARVRSLILVSSEPLGWNGPALPHISETILEHFGNLSALDWTDRDAVIAFLLGIDKLSAGSGQPFDEAGARARIEQVLDRANSPASMFNHATLSVREDWTGRFRDISCPVLVIHGEEDPVLPVENGRAIAAGIKDAELFVMPKVGHELPASQLPAIAERAAEHTHRFAKIGVRAPGEN